MDVAGRIGRVTDCFGAAGCDALLVTNLVNIRYLTGFTGSAARLRVQPGELAVLVTDGRYEDQAAEQLAAAGVEARVDGGPIAAGPARGAGSEVLRRRRPRRARGGARHLGRPAGLRAELVRRRRAGADRRPGRGAPRGEGRRRGGPHRGGCRHRRRGPGRRASPLLDDEPTEAEFALALDSAMRRLGRRAGPASRRSSPAGPTRPAPPPARRPSHRARATSSCSTSAPSSTATAPT